MNSEGVRIKKLWFRLTMAKKGRKWPITTPNVLYWSSGKAIIPERRSKVEEKQVRFEASVRYKSRNI